MPDFSRLAETLRQLQGVTVKQHEPLARYTRFDIGGPAEMMCEVAREEDFSAVLALVRQSGAPVIVIGGGTNLVVSDEGFSGIVLRFTGAQIEVNGPLLHAEAGAVLQDVVDASIHAGLEGLESMTGIPGSLGGAVYGNAGAYGRAMQPVVESVTWTDGSGVHEADNAACEFHYRESIFKRRKERVVLSATLKLSPSDSNALATKATEIRNIRDAKYPPTMKCAGSIFKNVFYGDLPQDAQSEVPATLVRDGKIPSAWFLEQAGVKGMRRGDIRVADYHANLIYNDGNGTASDLIAVIAKCKASVRARFGFDLEEEVQYVGFETVAA